MKKTLLIAAIAVFGFSNVNAQEDKPTYGFTEGNVLIEGNLGFNSENDKNSETKTSNFTFNPKAGYFLNEDLAVGLTLSYNSFNEEVAGTDTEDGSTFGAGVFARYYFLDLGKRFKTFTEFNVGFDTTKDDISDFKSNGLGLGLGLGINYFVKENIAITFGLSDVLSYRSDKVDVDGAEAVTEFNGNVNVFNNFFETAQFGLMFKF
ncbi:outer membrane beta-barrel protein [Lacinutrix salivirga]